MALPEQHALRNEKRVRLTQLKKEVFVKSDESDVPGLTRRTTAFCWKYGKFRPRYVGPTHSLAESLQMVANENAVAIMPAFARNHTATGVVWSSGNAANPACRSGLCWTRYSKKAEGKSDEVRALGAWFN